MKKKFLLVGLTGIMVISLTGCKKDKWVRCEKDISFDNNKYHIAIDGEIENKKIKSNGITIAITPISPENYGTVRDEFISKANEFKTIYGTKNVKATDTGVTILVRDVDKLPNGEKATEVSVNDFKKMAQSYDSELKCFNIKE